METSAPVKERPHGATATPTRRQRQAELRALELAAAGHDERPHDGRLHAERRHPATTHPAPFTSAPLGAPPTRLTATPRTAPTPRTVPAAWAAAPTAPSAPLATPLAQAAPAEAPRAASAPAPASEVWPAPAAPTPAAPTPLAPVPVAPQPIAPGGSLFPPTGIRRATAEPAAPLRTPSGEIPVVLVPAPTPLRTNPTPVVPAAAASTDELAAEQVFPSLSRRERRSGAPATGPTPVAPAAPLPPARGTLFGSRFVARAATGVAFVGALACVPLVIPGSGPSVLDPGGQRADLADDEDGNTTTIAGVGLSSEDEILERAESLLSRAEGSSASTPELQAAQAELLSLKEAILAERAEGSQRASRSGERTSLEDSAEVSDTVTDRDVAPVTTADVTRAAENLALQLQDYGEMSASVVTPAPATPAELAAERRVRAAALLDQCGSSKYSNGRIPAAALTTLSFAPSQSLRCDAAAMLEDLSDAYAERFGRPLPMTDTYRSYAQQVSTRAAKPGLAAVPGTSNHGWGLAIDLDAPASSPGSAQYKWLRANAPLYGWDNPSWARPGGSKPEPWHFEYSANW
ncbi:M15 family metallopeptidase [Oerskovia turbata]